MASSNLGFLYIPDLSSQPARAMVKGDYFTLLSSDERFVGTAERQRAWPLHPGAFLCVDPISWLPPNVLLQTPPLSVLIVAPHKPRATACMMDPGSTSQTLACGPGVDKGTRGTPRRPAGEAGIRHIPHPSEPRWQIEATPPQCHRGG
jgi:hypothetical protein